MNNELFTKRLKESIDESGLSLKEIAERAEIPLQPLKKYVEKNAIPSLRNFFKLRRALGFCGDYILQIGKYSDENPS